MKKISEIKVTYSSNNIDKPTVKSSLDSYKVLHTHWDMDTIELHEEFKVLLLNRANQALGVHHLSKGGVSGTVVDAKLIFSVALKCNASSIILAHNHPSCNKKPSQADIDITNKIKEGCRCLDMTLLDHLILIKDSYFSFADEGLL
jgi:DNA repair protein RadC